MYVIDISMPSGGRIHLWPEGALGVQYEAVMLSASGGRVQRSAGRLPAWATRLTIASTATGGLLEGGKAELIGRKDWLS
jgi:hypothetical protein